MKLYRLGSVAWQESQLLYHALPRLGREGLVLLSPASPYVSVGYFQDAAQEVDIDYCREQGIPVMRREVGGGAVFLDGAQLFYQLVIRRDNPLTPPSKEAFYRRFLEAPIGAYRALGIPAQYKPVNDIIANQRKVSGNGVAEIGDFVVFVGNLIVDFDYDMMARVLRVPDEKFRDRVHKTIYENLSTVKREIGEVPPTDYLWSLLANEFAKVLGPLEEVTTVDTVWRSLSYDLAQRFLTDDWLFGKPRPDARRAVTIRSGVTIHHKMHKAPGGLIRASAEVREETIEALSISGDFFFYPQDKLAALEAALVGVRQSEVEATVARFFEAEAIEAPGVTPADLALVLS